MSVTLRTLNDVMFKKKEVPFNIRAYTPSPYREDCVNIYIPLEDEWSNISGIEGSVAIFLMCAGDEYVIHTVKVHRLFATPELVIEIRRKHE